MIGEKTCNQSTQIVANSIYMIVLNVLHSARRKLSMKLQPQLPVPPFPHAFLPFLMPSSPSSCLPPLPHAFLPFLMPSSPSSCLPALPHAFIPLLMSLFPSHCSCPLTIAILRLQVCSDTYTCYTLPSLVLLGLLYRTSPCTPLT